MSTSFMLDLKNSLWRHHRGNLKLFKWKDRAGITPYMELFHRRQLSKCPIKCTDLFDIKFELFYVTMEIIPKNGNVPSGYFKCERWVPYEKRCILHSYTTISCDILTWRGVHESCWMHEVDQYFYAKDDFH